MDVSRMRKHNFHGPLLIDFLSQGSPIDSTQYCSTMKKLPKANSQVFSQNNTRPQCFSHKTQMTLNKFCWEVMEHLLYSLNFSLSDSYMIKRTLQGIHFTSDDKMKKAMQDFMKNQPQIFCSKSIYLCCNGHVAISCDFHLNHSFYSTCPLFIQATLL